ncbi:(2Fe-2S) ferredoxin domain-containing protein [Spirochaeta isovalerica]|uniref:NADH:ubiquinone oxidoreductase subunit E n=1 Tax=Spirochaeta isovalerica TaxID=150 RepID=A0A841RAQ1_9SPIO|nr:(2Fe-2S) ferredoxin domain-containing protein [Spirochaeta isovalerica]MBB6482464.1 NADH:ubiquinone oxidoreductase subunit E [Spirochaeta isovalerica]
MKVQIEICMGSSCFARGNSRLLSFLEEYIAGEGLASRVGITGHLCMGNCSSGPVVRIDGMDYFDLKEADLARLLGEALDE